MPTTEFRKVGSGGKKNKKEPQFFYHFHKPTTVKCWSSTADISIRIEVGACVVVLSEHKTSAQQVNNTLKTGIIATVTLGTGNYKHKVRGYLIERRKG